MAKIDARYDLQNEKGLAIELESSDERPDDYEVVDLLVRALHKDEVSPFGGPTDKPKSVGGVADVVPAPREVMRRYGILSILYSVNGAEQITIYSVGR